MGGVGAIWRHYVRLLVVAGFYPLPSRDFSDVCSACKKRRNLLFSPCNLQAENKSFATPVSNYVSVVSCAPVLARPVVTVRAHHPQESLSMCKSLLFSFQCLSCPTREVVASVTAARPGEIGRPGGRTTLRRGCQRDRQAIRTEVLGTGEWCAQTIAIVVPRPFDTPGHWSERSTWPLEIMDCAQGGEGRARTKDCYGCHQGHQTTCYEALPLEQVYRTQEERGAHERLPRLPPGSPDRLNRDIVHRGWAGACGICPRRLRRADKPPERTEAWWTKG